MKQNKESRPTKLLAVKEVLYNFGNLWVKDNHIPNVPVDWGSMTFFVYVCVFSYFVICHSTKNVHGNYKQTSQ